MLLGAEDAVTGIAEARQDVAVLVEFAVDGRGVDRHVGMRLGNAAMPSGQVSRHTNLMNCGHVLQSLHGCDGRVAGGKHRIDDDDVALLQLAGHLEVMLNGTKGLGSR